MSQQFSSAKRSDPSAAPAPCYAWRAPGKAIEVRFPFDLIDRLEHLAVENFRSLEARGSEVGGLLFGGLDPAVPATLWIQDFEPVPCDYSRGPLYRLSDADLERFQAAAGRRTASGFRVAGFFRSHSRKGLALDAEDMAVIQPRFGDPSQVVLLLRPFATKVTSAGIFIWEDGRMRGESSYLEFPFRSSELTAAEFQKEPQAPSLADADEHPLNQRLTRAPVLPMPSRLKITRAVPAVTVAPPVAVEPAVASAQTAPPAPPKPEPPAPPPARQEAAPVAVAAPPKPPEPPKPVVRAPEPKPAEPVPAPELKVKESTPAPAPELKPREPIPAPKPVEDEPLEPVAAKSSRGKLLWISVAGAILACSGALFVYPGILRHTATRPPVALTLRVEHTTTDLLLTWNQDSDAVRNAKKAVLFISDGERQENLDLNLSDLRNGSIVYSPLSSDVSFRMEITGSDKSKTASESVRVLRTKPSPMSPLDAAGQTKPNTAPQTPDATSPIGPVPDPALTAEQPAARHTPARTFTAPTNVASLSERLRTPLPTDMPEAPAVADASSGGSVNLGLLAPAQVSMAAPADTKAAAAAAPTDIRQPQLTSLVKPVYPDIARRQGIAGTVSLSVTIGADGRIKNAKVVSGPELLRKPAMDAVKQWLYSPATVGGRAVDSEKQLDVNFSLAR